MSTAFDFDEWATLYKDDPEEFERRRKQATTELIAQAPADKQLKLHQLQWKLDGIHRTQTPFQAMLSINNLMWESLLNLNDQMQALVSSTLPPPKPTLTRVK